MDCSEVEELAGAIALRALPAEEARAVEEHLATCADAHASVSELRRVVSLLPFAVDEVEPPPRLLTNLLAAALADEAPGDGAVPPSADLLTFPLMARTGAGQPEAAQPSANGGPALAPLPLASVPPGSAIRIDEARRRRRTWASPALLAAAALLALSIGLGAWNVGLRNRLDDKTTANSRQARALATLLTAAQVVPLQSQTGLQATLVRTPSGETSLVLGRAPGLSGGQVYEAWFIHDNTPVRAGVFSGADNAVVTLQGAASGAELVAITVEPAGGSAQPTSSPIASAKIS